MKKIGLVCVMALLAVSVFARGGAQNQGGVPEVTVWAAGSDNVQLIYEKLVDAFNSNPNYNKTCVVKLQFMPTGAGTQTIQDRVLAAYQAGQKNTSFDIVEVGDEQMSTFVTRGGADMFVAYDTAKIPNLAGVQARPPIGSQFYVPYRGTTVVIAYNADAIPNPPKTVDELTAWIKDHPGRFAYNAAGTGGAGDSFIRSSIYNYLPEEAYMSSDSKWAEQWDQGFAYLKEIHPYLYKSSGRVVYPNKNQGTMDLLANKEIDMCPAWADMMLQSLDSGSMPSGIRIAQIQPSLTGSLACLGIPSFGSHPNEAHAFIDFMLSPEAQNILLKDMAAIPLIASTRLDSAQGAKVKDLDVAQFRTQAIGDLIQPINKRWNDEIATLP